MPALLSIASESRHSRPAAHSNAVSALKCSAVRAMVGADQPKKAEKGWFVQSLQLATTTAGERALPNPPQVHNRSNL
jgi:hypothetical protein